MTQNQGNGQPPQAPMPDHRIDEIMASVRQLREENQRLKGTIDYMAQQRNAPPPPAPEPDQGDFDPKVQSALTKFVKNEFQKLYQPKEQNIQNWQRFVSDRDDLIAFQLQWGPKSYEENKDKIEQLRMTRAQMGQPITREDAYKFIKFEEEQRKPKPKPFEGEQNQPKYDPYTGRMIVPDAPADPNQPQQTVANVPQNPQQQSQAAPGQLPPQPNQQQPAKSQYFSETNPESVLPAQGTPAPATRGGPERQAPIDLTSDEAALEAWANKYGDIPVP